MVVKIQYRRGLASQWTASNPILAEGEPGYETDTGKIKVGDGVNHWSSLPYSSGLKGDTGDTGPQGQGIQGIQGVAGPNQVTPSTDTNITGILKGAASKIAQATAGVDYAAASHTHAESEVTNLAADLAGKAPSSHAHAESDVTNLVSDLAGKAPTSHTHTESNITNLVSDLAGKAPTSHTHTESNITNLTTDLAAKEATANKGVASGYASLDASSLVVQNPTNATATKTASKIPIADANGLLNSWRAAAATPATTGTMTVNMNNSNVITITPTGACTFNASGGVAGNRVTFIITTSGTTSFTLTWGTNFKVTGTLATGTTTGKVFCITFACKDGTTWCETGRTVAM